MASWFLYFRVAAVLRRILLERWGCCTGEIWAVCLSAGSDLGAGAAVGE